MKKKSKFKPMITRIKLNPEQAVLACTCYNVGRRATAGANDWRNDGTTNALYCSSRSESRLWYCNISGGTANRQRLTGSASSS